MWITNRNANKQHKQTTKKKTKGEEEENPSVTHDAISRIRQKWRKLRRDFRWLCITLLCVLKSTTETKDRINSKYGNGNGTIFV